jgi:hypothetical protein
MKATILLIALLALAMAALSAQAPAVGLGSVAHYGSEPVWMLLSGATLLSLASALRRFLS